MRMVTIEIFVATAGVLPVVGELEAEAWYCMLRVYREGQWFASPIRASVFRMPAGVIARRARWILTVREPLRRGALLLRHACLAQTGERCSRPRNCVDAFGS
jgi:hypothetical protein